MKRHHPFLQFCKYCFPAILHFCKCLLIYLPRAASTNRWENRTGTH
ncbi:hypothetical protein HMPREF1326_02413 [Akkermansia sp. KLE1605]|nr:hypothetical protein HMPREF1326_02413 [Akkermansia sp. KLE1605]